MDPTTALPFLRRVRDLVEDTSPQARMALRDLVTSSKRAESKETPFDQLNELSVVASMLRDVYLVLAMEGKRELHPVVDALDTAVRKAKLSTDNFRDRGSVGS